MVTIRVAGAQRRGTATNLRAGHGKHVASAATTRRITRRARQACVLTSGRACRHGGRYTLQMQIQLNGQTHECKPGTTVAVLLDETGHGEGRVAVEVNREIVSRSRHADRNLHEGDRVEIVQAIGGG